MVVLVQRNILFEVMKCGKFMKSVPMTMKPQGPRVQVGEEGHLKMEGRGSKTVADLIMVIKKTLLI